MSIRTVRLIIVFALLLSIGGLVAAAIFVPSGKTIQLEEAGIIGMLTASFGAVMGYYFRRPG